MKELYLLIRNTIFMMLLLLINHFNVTAQPSTPLFSEGRAEIERLLFSGDWNGLWTTLNAQREDIHDSLLCSETEPEFRLLLGHAALATNNSNTAAWSFYCDCDSTSSQSLSRWEAFTKELLRKQPDNPNSIYLFADALARNDRLEEAKIQLDSAIEIAKGHVLSRNARGVIQWILFEKTKEDYFREGCVGDFYWCIKHNPLFVDSWLNQGVQNFRNLSFDVSHFIEALQLNRKSILGQIGKAVIYATRGETRYFFSSMDGLYKEAPNFPLVAFNSGNLTRFPPGVRGWEFKGGGSINDWHISTKVSSSNGDNRGGVYIVVDENNSPIFKDDTLRLAGITFALNYPFPNIFAESSRK